MPLSVAAKKRLDEILKLPFDSGMGNIDLSGLVGTAGKPVTPETANLAKYIIGNANTNWNSVPPAAPAPKNKIKDTDDRSWLGDLLDVLQTTSSSVLGGYQAAQQYRAKQGQENAANNLVFGTDRLQDLPGELAAGFSGALKGLTHKEHTSGSEVIQTEANIKKAREELGDVTKFEEVDAKVNPWKKHGAGFIADVFADPLTYGTLGLGALAKHGINKISSANRIIDEVAAASNKTSRPPIQTATVEDLPAGLRNLTKPSTPDIKLPGIAGTSPVTTTTGIPRISGISLSSKLPTAERLYPGPKTQTTVIPGKGRELLQEILPDLKPFGKAAVPTTKGAEQLIDEAVMSAPPVAPKVKSPEIKEHHQIAALKLADQYDKRALSEGLPNRWGSRVLNNPAKQANLFSSMLKNSMAQLKTSAPKIKSPRSTTFTKQRYTIAYNMMKVAEEELIKRGKPPRYWDDTPIRLTDVIDELGGPAALPQNEKHMTELLREFSKKDPNKIINPQLKQAIENIRARSAMADANVLDDVIAQATQKADNADDIMPPARAKILKQSLKNDIKDAPVSDAGAKAGRKLLDEILRMSVTHPLKAIHSVEDDIFRQLQINKHGKIQAQINAKTSKGIEKAGGETYSHVAKQTGPFNKAVEYMMVRLTTWYGQKDLRPLAMHSLQSAYANAYRRARFWNQIAKTHSKDEINDALRVAQGAKDPELVSDKALKLSTTMKDAMERLFASSGLSELATKGSSVATRSGIIMEDMNKQLTRIGSKFQFTNGKGINYLGDEVDYSQGIDWLKSWEIAEPKDAIEFMYQLDLSVEQVTKRYAFLDEAAIRFGSHIKHGEYQHMLPLEVSTRLHGTYFPEDIAMQMTRVIEDFRKSYNKESDIIRNYDKILRVWKSGVTKYFPSHHIRNAIGDIYLSWMAGVNNPNVYRKAIKIQYAQKGRYKNLEDIENLTDKDAISMAMSKPGETILKTRSGHKLTIDQVYTAAHNHGLLLDVHIIEDIFGNEIMGKIQPLRGYGRKTADTVAMQREHTIKLAHFVDALTKSKESNLKLAFDIAAREVRKWHPDGADLTDVEKKVFRRLIPFYSWLRKSTPLLLESIVTKPGKTLVYPKGMFELQGALGIETEGLHDPFPEEHLFPEWIKDKGIGPLVKPGVEGSFLGQDIFRQKPEGYGFINPGNPLFDTGAQFANPLKGLLGSLTPPVRVSGELATSQRAVGAPIDETPSGYAEYLGEQVPLIAPVQRTLGFGLGGKTARAEKIDEKSTNMEAILNYLTAAGIRSSGPYVRQGMFEEIDRLKKKAGLPK